ncbi:hypothetical protein APHAL10511_007891 [Amanita phalloides]|nr:hypothetical protein APHAL10511_007891 [Amanita phalloides]
MANIIRSPKSGSDWGGNELMAYNITIIPKPPQQFFPQGGDMPLTDLDPALVTATLDADDVSDDTYRFLSYLDIAINTSQETAIGDFAREVLRTLGFEERGLVLRNRHIFPLTICGDSKATQIDVCLSDRWSLVLLVLQGERTIFSDPEAQVIAEAIAVYQHNNMKRQRVGVLPLDAMTVPCITMVGTRPTFYLVPVTKALSDTVINGQLPSVCTEVFRCVTVAGDNRRSSEGMENPEYRRVAFQHFLAFKALAKSHWEKFLAD